MFAGGHMTCQLVDPFGEYGYLDLSRTGILLMDLEFFNETGFSGFDQFIPPESLSSSKYFDLLQIKNYIISAVKGEI